MVGQLLDDCEHVRDGNGEHDGHIEDGVLAIGVGHDVRAQHDDVGCGAGVNGVV